MGKADISVNNWLEEKERFADLFNGVIFEGKQVIQPNELEKISPVTSVSTKNRRGKRRNVKKYRDVIMKWKNEIALVLLANESQDKIHYAMPPKVMIYDSLDYEEQMRENWNKVMTKRKADKTQGNEMEHLTAEEYLSRFRKKDKLIPVISLVLYYGEEEWDAPQELYEMFQLQGTNEEMKILKKYLPNYKINLVDAQRFENTDQFQTDLQVIFNMLKCRGDKEHLSEYINEHKEYFDNVDDESRQAVQAFLGMDKIPGEDAAGKGQKMKMCTAIQEMYDDGRRDGYESGIRDGYANGEQEKIIDLVAKKMNKNQSVEQITDALEMEQDVVQQIYDLVKKCNGEIDPKEIRIKLQEQNELIK